ncbi:hypothetical protein [Parabacteroides goldsteinii]|uniref:hypothetical protein n=1 Tax=Parabacteroides goldsteinii TaxID=328812 RepID=UPI001DB8DEA4|nr:hypothetical protein [Parabacteroides goldsteinii]MBS6574800.1 hypothetical protein [Parabacteroides goldsteinii]
MKTSPFFLFSIGYASRTPIYIKICVMLIFLFCVLNPLFAQDRIDSTSELSDVTNQTSISNPEDDGYSTDSTMIEVEPRACVNTFENKTITLYTSVSGCTTLTVKNINVTGTGNLSLSAPDQIVINGPFEALLGGVLSMNCEQPKRMTFIFKYDGSGNQKLRQYNSIPASLSSSNMKDRYEE